MLEGDQGAGFGQRVISSCGNSKLVEASSIDFLRSSRNFLSSRTAWIRALVPYDNWGQDKFSPLLVGNGGKGNEVAEVASQAQKRKNSEKIASINPDSS